MGNSATFFTVINPPSLFHCSSWFGVYGKPFVLFLPLLLGLASAAILCVIFPFCIQLGTVTGGSHIGMILYSSRSLVSEWGRRLKMISLEFDSLLRMLKSHWGHVVIY